MDLNFIVLNKVDSIDWLIKTSLAEGIHAYKVLEDERLWNIGEWGTLLFVEVFNEDICVARFMYSIDVLFCVIVYPPFRNKGILKEILEWVNKNTTVVELTTTNQIVTKTALKYGYTVTEVFEGEYSGEPTDRLRRTLS
jgi:GNAT superfamily N-acetyltransferase